jgi:hypothetical protein
MAVCRTKHRPRDYGFLQPVPILPLLISVMSIQRPPDADQSLISQLVWHEFMVFSDLPISVIWPLPRERLDLHQLFTPVLLKVERHNIRI